MRSGGDQEPSGLQRRISAAIDADPDFNRIGRIEDIYQLSKHER